VRRQWWWAGAVVVVHLSHGRQGEGCSSAGSFRAAFDFNANGQVLNLSMFERTVECAREDVCADIPPPGEGEGM